ncbi:cysteine desulfurase family protein [Thiofilum flexile]|uniref:cysteine desulfurase family protein n=1 Tax=Thiofilum flexile TaxID=125627 RepID=UPI001B7F80F6|nr:cysteine desulfurase family protein [Thiofilum flexile]
MDMNVIYLDTASSTPVAQEVIDVMLGYLGAGSCYYNPSSAGHILGQQAADSVLEAKSVIANLLGCHSDEVIFTSGATEANNLALRGIAYAHAATGRHLVTSLIEHKSVLETCHALEHKGFVVTYLKPNSHGRIDPETVQKALRPDTLMVSLQYINNETGVIQPIHEIAALLEDAGVLFHVDAAQAVGKFAIDLEKTPIDLLSLSAHKFYGPKGIGCLIIRNRRYLKLEPMLTGGGQEFGLRSGTLPTHQIHGLKAALALACNCQTKNYTHVCDLKRQFIEGLQQSLSIKIHGDVAHSSPYIVNFSVKGISTEALINQLSAAVALSSGSACSSGTIDPSYVLRAMGIEGEDLYGAVRASFSQYHQYSEISAAVRHIISAVQRMQELE